jgi:hypothetical protein
MIAGFIVFWTKIEEAPVSRNHDGQKGSRSNPFAYGARNRIGTEKGTVSHQQIPETK